MRWSGLLNRHTESANPAKQVNVANDFWLMISVAVARIHFLARIIFNLQKSAISKLVLRDVFPFSIRAPKSVALASQRAAKFLSQVGLGFDF
jgi:hypothetical protein